MNYDFLPSEVRIFTFSNTGTTHLKQKIGAISSVKLGQGTVIKVILTPDAAITVLDIYGNTGEVPIAQNASRTFEFRDADNILVKGTANIVCELYYKKY